VTRHEFPAAVKREALERSGGQCEAVGGRNGLPDGVRCQRPVYKGRVQFDHYPRGAHDPHPDTVTIGNCTACCPECNQYAANNTDKAVEAKIKRVRRKHGLDPDTRKPRPKMRSRGFQRGAKAKIPSRPFPRRTK
jgi:hypothetical protein